MKKNFKFDICICGHVFKDIIYILDSYPKENSNKHYDAEVITKYGGILNTIRGLRFLNKSLKIKASSIVGNDEDGKLIINELKKLKINYNDIQKNNLTNNSLHLINKKRNTKTFIVRFLSKKPKKTLNIADSKWVHFMYLDNKEFLKQFGNLVMKKKSGQFFSADISNRTIDNVDLKKYLKMMDCLIFSTKEIPSLFKSNDCLEFNKHSMSKLKDLSILVKKIIVHNNKKSIAFIDGFFYESENLKKIHKQKFNITGAGDNFSSFIINQLISKKMFSKISLSDAHKFSSDYCLGKLY